MPHAINRVKPL